MGRLLKLIIILLFITSCGHQPHSVKTISTHQASLLAAMPSVSIVESTSTTLQKASRSAVRTVTPKPIRQVNSVSVMPDDFWWRLSHNCECSGGSGCANSGGWFQFKGSTAREVGYFPGATYEQQLEMAKWWLVQIGGRGGTRSGWPICWWRALKT